MKTVPSCCWISVCFGWNINIVEGLSAFSKIGGGIIPTTSGMRALAISSSSSISSRRCFRFFFSRIDENPMEGIPRRQRLILGMSVHDDEHEMIWPSERKHRLNLDVRKARMRAEVDAMLSADGGGGGATSMDIEEEWITKQLTKNSNDESKSSLLLPRPFIPETIEDEQTSTLESELNDAISKEDFDLASYAKLQLDRLQMDDYGTVLHANSQFYYAFSAQNYSQMISLWSQNDSTAIYIHPPYHHDDYDNEALVGSQSIFQNYKNLFLHHTDNNNENETENVNSIHPIMEPSNINIVVRGSAAIVTCNENVFYYVPKFGNKNDNQKKKLLVNQFTATNIFRKIHTGSWKIVHHHSSCHTPTHAAFYNNKNKNNDNDNPFIAHGVDDTSSTHAAMTRFIPHHTKSYSDFPPTAEDGIENDKYSIDNHDGSPKRVFIGSLTDFLHNNHETTELDGIVKPTTSDDALEDDDDYDDLDDAAATTVQQDSLFTNNFDDFNDNYNDGRSSRNVHLTKDTILQHHKEEHDDDNNLIDFSDNNTNKKSIPKSSFDNANNGDCHDDTLRQSCISAIRKLCHQGAISNKQKRMLLTDIITCSARGEFSTIEIAYEILCGDETNNGVDSFDKQEIEEFADQCRIFATSLQ